MDTNSKRYTKVVNGYWRLVSFIERKYTSPFYAAITTGLGVFLGLYGSIYTEEIKKSFPLAVDYSSQPPYVLLPDGPFSVHSLAFWLGLMLFSLLFFFHQRAKDSQTVKLEDLIRTLPPEDVLALFAVTITDCHDATLAVLTEENPTTDQFDQTIRVVLNSLLTLAQRFDNAPRNVIYAANIMLFQSTANLDGESVSIIRKRLRYSEPETDIRLLRGILDIVPALSTSTAAGSAVDTALPLFAMAVPQISKGADGHWRVLPGASKAFVTGSLDGYADARTLHKWCRDQQQFSMDVCNQLETYFAKETDSVRSFVSIPIGRRDRDTLVVEDPVGVLNIHRDIEGILGGELRTKMFDSITQPFQTLIMDLLEARGGYTIDTGNIVRR